MIVQLEIPAPACTLSFGLLLQCQMDLDEMNFSVVCFSAMSLFLNPAFVSCFLPPDNCGAGRDRQPGSEHILQYLLGKFRLLSYMRCTIHTEDKSNHKTTFPCLYDCFLYRYGSPSGPNTVPCATAALPSLTTTVPGWGTVSVCHQHSRFMRTSTTHTLPNYRLHGIFICLLRAVAFLLCFISSIFHFKKPHVSALNFFWFWCTAEKHVEGNVSRLSKLGYLL